MDGCETICYVLTGKIVKKLNKQKKFTDFYGILNQSLGEEVMKTFFYEAWVKNNNIKAINRNRWEAKHGGIKAGVNQFHPTSVRKFARMSI